MKMEQLINLGAILILAGFIMVFIGMLQAAKESKTKVAVGGFIGFIPFGFGNDKDMVWFVTVLSAVLFIIWAIFRIKG
ncbi:DUF131 domain-containing protein [Candidatus Woesearchaeota archaeon]|nr:DUF131 domain-containing protein [Candidatus Woesearchaeota archaeon]